MLTRDVTVWDFTVLKFFFGTRGLEITNKTDKYHSLKKNIALFKQNVMNKFFLQVSTQQLEVSLNCHKHFKPESSVLIFSCMVCKSALCRP